MKRGAEILVRTCAGVAAGESVVVVTDQQRMAIAVALTDEIEAAGAVPSIVVPPPRSIDNEEPGPLVAAALLDADVVFLPVSLAMAHTRSVRDAIGAGARVLSMTAFTERMMREGGLFTVEAGFVTSIEGGEQARQLDDLLASQDDKWVYNLAQFAFGLNLDCVEFTGEMLNDEGIDGTVHIGIGTSANLGGTISAKTHFDAICREPTVWIDDEVVVRGGPRPAGHRVAR